MLSDISSDELEEGGVMSGMTSNKYNQRRRVFGVLDGVTGGEVLSIGSGRRRSLIDSKLSPPRPSLRAIAALLSIY